MHPFGDLSAYLDGALSPEDRASVQAHLDTCALCRTRLAELRGTAQLIAALPALVPSRSLVPRVSVPVWLAPLRTFSTFASAAAIFLFLASAALSSFPRATSAGSAPAAAPAPNTVSAPQASEAAGTAPGSQDFRLSAPTAAPGVATNQPSAAGNSTAPADTAKEVVRADAASPSSGAVVDQSTRLNPTRFNPAAEPAPFAFLLSPLLWLVLAIVFGASSFILGRRLRSA